jgi:hypothetical protein
MKIKDLPKSNRPQGGIARALGVSVDDLIG